MIQVCAGSGRPDKVIAMRHLLKKSGQVHLSSGANLPGKNDISLEFSTCRRHQLRRSNLSPRASSATSSPENFQDDSQNFKLDAGIAWFRMRCYPIVTSPKIQQEGVQKLIQVWPRSFRGATKHTYLKHSTSLLGAVVRKDHGKWWDFSC